MWKELAGGASDIVEIAGIATLLVGVLVAGVLALVQLRHGGALAYRVLRRRVGRATLLGLELLVVADIISTVIEPITLESLVVLAGIVAIRTFLSFALEVELEGRVPWRRELSAR